jgi:hypothetical protein
MHEKALLEHMARALEEIQRRLCDIEQRIAWLQRHTPEPVYPQTTGLSITVRN